MIYRKTKIFMPLILLCLFQTMSAGFSSAAALTYSNTPVVKSAYAVIIDQKTGKVLFEKERKTKTHPASLTKIMTSLLILENLSSNDDITVGSEINTLEKDSIKAGLKKGQKISAQELVWALMLPSGNDAAYTAAVSIARKKSGNATMQTKEAIQYFSGMMNARARQIGAVDSNFTNPDGYPDPSLYSTAFDMALISREALKNAFFKEVVRTYAYTGGKNTKTAPVVPGKDTEHVWFNKNMLLNPKSEYFYEYATGIKTGYTLKAGYCLAASAERNDLSLVSVILNADSEKTRCMETRALFDYVFSNYQYRTISAKGNMVCNANVIRKYFGDTENVNLLTDSDYTGLLSEEQFARVEKSYLWEDAILSKDKNRAEEINFTGPIRQGQIVGKIRYALDGVILTESNLVASKDVMKGDFKDGIVNFLDQLDRYKYIFISALFCIAAGLIFLKIMRRKRQS